MKESQKSRQNNKYYLHELRRPATVIKGYCSLLIEGFGGPVTEKQKEILNKIYQSNEDLIKLLEELSARLR